MIYAAGTTIGIVSLNVDDDRFIVFCTFDIDTTVLICVDMVISMVIEFKTIIDRIK